ncbi:uncharacterized protein N7482_006005 [Penicillium canariense]|uniref:Uncharacterized protein n=1 Tax=Penicillium canariense TaxID=189055 RepID=A0A9W9I5W3_9EURO|nr:uncharacterized protein N7482_006005 [Penicillium canariense]KAJ5167224.1 hypothetical protein N7482_006005 [Penicillium canariense]
MSVDGVFAGDFVGEVTELGSKVAKLSKGDLIVGLIWGGRSARSRHGLALFSKGYLNVDRSKSTGTSVLVWGGSSSVRIVNDSTRFHLGLGRDDHLQSAPDLVQSYGAKQVFDYNDPEVIEKINEVAPDLRHIFDTIGNGHSSTTSSRAFGDREGNLCTVRPGKATTEHVTRNAQVTDVLAWTAFWKDHRYARLHWPASKDDHELASELFEKLPAWLE